MDALQPQYPLHDFPHTPPADPTSLPSHLLSHPVTMLGTMPPAPAADTLQPSLLHRFSLLRVFSMPVPYHVAILVCDLFTALVLSIMIVHTLFYIKRRRAGLIGPALATPLIKFWSLFAFLDSFLHLLHPYLTLFALDSVLSLLRALTLLVLMSGRRLSVSAYLYDTHLVPFYSSHQPQIEHTLTTLRQSMRRVDEAFKELATYLLQRMAVGGLTGVAQGLSDIFSQAVNQNLDAAQLQQQQDLQHGQSLSSRPVSRQGERKNGVLVADGELELFERGRQFFAGEPDERAKALRGKTVDEMMGVMQTANAEPPKAAYERVRELRRRFRRRGNMVGKIKEGGG